jgi:hypothetical protein
MKDKKGQIMSKKEFMKNGSYNFTKEYDEGLLISADTDQSGYNIGVQLSEDQVLVVDQADESRVRERIQLWAPKVQEIQRDHQVQRAKPNFDNSGFNAR